jgi:hypothetical protein
MAEKISITKGFDNDTFDTYVPQLSDNADIQNAFELFYYGDSTVGNATGDVSLHANLVDFDSRITSTTSQITGHAGAVLDAHGIGAGNLIVGTGTTQTLTNKTINLTSNTLTGTKAQFNAALSDDNFATIAGAETLTNKTLTSPVITGGTLNSGVALTVDSTELNVLDGITASTAELNIMDGVTASTTELNYVDGVTSSIQTQINTNTPTGMISIHSAATAPTGWLLCDGTSYSTTTYANLYGVIGYTFGGSGANFSVPNLKGKVVVGIDAAQVEFDTRGETGGAMTHQHAASNSGNSTPTTSGASTGNTTGGASTGNTTGGASTGNTTGGASAGNTTGNNSSNHNHSVNPASFTTGADNHSHTNDTNNAYFKVSSGSSSLNVASGQHSHDINSDNHAHNVDVPSTTSGAQSANHTHDTTDHTHSTTDHTHSTTDHSHNTADHDHTVLHAHTTPASSSLSNLQPYMALNYIIKI